MSTTEANLIEIFSSVQGEGIYLGERQIFLRFAGCNLSCQYCDTPAALEIPRQVKIEAAAGKGEFKQEHNPLTLERILQVIDDLNKPKNLHHSVSITGGEPLLQVDFLKNLLPEITKRDLLVYLETNGVLPDHLLEVIDNVDIIAMDIKLPSATGLTSYMDSHRKFLKIAVQQLVPSGERIYPERERGSRTIEGEVMVKIVFTRETTVREIDEAAQLIAAVSPKIPLVLQPVTPHGPIKHRPLPREGLALQAAARRHLDSVRIIPQVHKIIGYV